MCDDPSAREVFYRAFCAHRNTFTGRLQRETAFPSLQHAKSDASIRKNAKETESQKAIAADALKMAAWFSLSEIKVMMRSALIEEKRTNYLVAKQAYALKTKPEMKP